MFSDIENYTFEQKDDARHVGTLYRWRSQQEECSKPIDLWLYRDVFLQLNAPCSSSLDPGTGIRLYSVLFDSKSRRLSPLVYAEPLSPDGAYWNGTRIEKDDGAVLLSDGDVIGLLPTSGYVFRCRKPGSKRISEKQREETRIFEEEYELKDRTVGKGGFSTVFLAWNKTKEKQVACKVMDSDRQRRRLEEFDKQEHDGSVHTLRERKKRRQHLLHCIQWRIKRLSREIEVLQYLRHPNIAEIEKVFRTENTCYVFQELATGCDLWSFLSRRGKLPEVEAAAMVRQILQGIEYLHDNNVVHRDIKLDNILLASCGSDTRLTITDFGCAKVLSPEKPQMRTVLGTLEYNAPEVLNIRVGVNPDGFYTKSVDLWALGRLTALLVTYFCPFNKQGHQGFSVELARTANVFMFEGKHEWLALGWAARDFILRLLVKKGGGRMTATEALAHEWITGSASEAESVSVYEQARSEWSRQSDAVIEDCGASIRTQSSESIEEILPETPSHVDDTPARPKKNRMPPIKPFRSSDQWNDEVRQLQDSNWLVNPRTPPPMSAARQSESPSSPHEDKNKGKGTRGKIKGVLQALASLFRKKQNDSLSDQPRHKRQNPFSKVIVVVVERCRRKQKKGKSSKRSPRLAKAIKLAKKRPQKRKKREKKEKGEKKEKKPRPARAPDC